MNLYRGLDAPRPSAEKLSTWEYEADFIYRAQVVERTSARPLAKAIQNDVNHAQRILVLIAELERVREERDEAQAVIARLEGEVNQARNERDALLQQVTPLRVERDASRTRLARIRQALDA